MVVSARNFPPAHVPAARVTNSSFRLQGGIGDLLASIEGDKPSPSPARPVARNNVLPKRKADDQLRKEPLKTVRTGDKAGSSPALTSRPAPRPATDRPAPRAPVKPAPGSRYNGATGPRGPPGPAKPPASTTPAAAAPPSAPAKPPKKGSFAEIMARGQRAQATMGQVGKIQHKRIEKPAKKEKDEPKADPRAGPRKPGNPPPHAGGPSKGAKAPADPKARRNAPAADPEPKKKVRRPPPTTGYAGTARPRSTPPASRAAAKPPSGGAVLNPRVRRPSRAREDDEESMDSFVIDDEEEEEAYAAAGRSGPQYRYDSGDESSDMEAGMDEIDDEEAMAAAIARRDDLREEEMERQRKLEKERRKRAGMR